MKKLPLNIPLNPRFYPFPDDGFFWQPNPLYIPSPKLIRLSGIEEKPVVWCISGVLKLELQ